MSLPAVAASVTAEAVAALPGRLRAKLDTAVAQASGWPVEVDGDTVRVRPDDTNTVTLTAPVAEPGDAVCSCLLAPRCLHRIAVLSIAPVLDDPPPPAETPGTETAAEAEGREEVRVGAGSGAGVRSGAVSGAGSGAGAGAGSGSGSGSGAEVGSGVGGGETAAARAAGALRTVAAALLSTGVPGGGAVAQADLLRAVHHARAAGLHAASAAAVRVVEQLRATRRDDPAFRLAGLTDDLRELLTICHRLAAGDSTAAGVARRDYEPVGDLRLYGLFCEPVRAATGHAGAATYLADGRGRIWMVSDVKPADPTVATTAVRASADFGEVRLSHHELARAGILAINAHASAAGRLSHGRARQAVAAAGAGWFDVPLDGLWQVDPAAQAERWLTAAALPAHERPAAHDLAFLDGVLLGADRRGLLVALDRHELTVVVAAPHEDPALPYVANLRLLATHAAGSRVRIVGRFTGARRVAALALAARWLPDRFGGHIDLGAASLTRADVPGSVPSPAIATADPPAPPLHLVRHQLERVVAAGRSALLSGAGDDARRLAAAHLRVAAAVTTALGAAGGRRTRDVFGRLDPHDAEQLAHAWLTAATYEQAAAREVTRSAWAAPAAAPGEVREG